MRIGLSRSGSILLVTCLSLLIIIFAAGCAKKSSTSAPPKERSYGIVDPNSEYEGMSSEERHQLLFENLGSATDDTVVPLTFNGDYEVLFAYIDHDLNFHTNPQSAKITKVVTELGKTDNFEIDPRTSIEEVISRFNTNTRQKWMYGPYDSSVDRIILSLEFNNPLLRRHLDPMSYNYPVTITTILEDKPLLEYTKLEASASGERTDYIIYEWQAIGDHRYRLAIKKGSPAETEFDVEAFVISTFE